MVILRYDEALNVQKLQRLSSLSRLIFALLCATRILPAYSRFHNRTGRGDPTTLKAILERLWRDVKGVEMSKAEIEVVLATCMDLIPNEINGWDEETQPYAGDAASAIAYALRVRLSGDPQEAAWAGRCVYEAIDHFVISKGGQTPSGAEAELVILSNPLVQAELRRQQRDLQDLSELERTGLESSCVQKLRERSELESRSLLGT